MVVVAMLAATGIYSNHVYNDTGYCGQCVGFECNICDTFYGNVPLSDKPELLESDEFLSFGPVECDFETGQYVIPVTNIGSDEFETWQAAIHIDNDRVSTIHQDPWSTDVIPAEGGEAVIKIPGMESGKHEILILTPGESRQHSTNNQILSFEC